MRQDRITLSGLAFACYIFDKIDNGTYGEFLKQTNHSPDLSDREHCLALLKWLNNWGCRIAKASHDELSEQLSLWYKKHSAALFDQDSNLWELSEDELSSVGKAHEGLLECSASYYTRNGENRSISFGHTPTSKILFAIRPKALIMWDKPIREAYVGLNGSYIEFLREIKLVIGALKCQCKRCGFELEELPEKLERPNSTIPKLIDEYNWVTITKGYKPPDRQTLRRWADWKD